ncbi:aldo/keto reductase [Bacillaceae bacterium SIJ1]|uniref:aldo/keto reductase n=1 Tax=Litoribacterium kuwaitense TaxID=1398745 RepID=UPI0013EC2AED|nr:aldo/keto reductase [Litoribacterium kuwaitense]NGP46597.1 aldo/keto reductase [Litoribacterium kuwaitense]
MLQTVQLGKTDLHVVPVGLGTNAVGGHNIFPNLDDQVGKNVVKTALDEGINFLDTAFIYGPERSEELIGEVLTETGQRSDVILATKGAHKIVDGEVTLVNTPSFLKQSVDESLRRLQTDYIDLFYIHFPDETTQKSEAVGALKELRDAGKIRTIGVSNFSLEQLKDANQDGYVDVVQDEFNLLKRQAENTLLPYCIENDISFIPYFPLASGLLSGKYDEHSTFEDGRANHPLFQGKTYQQNIAKVNELKKIANHKKIEVAHLVLSWYLHHEAIDVVIPGAKQPEQVLRNLKTIDVSLTSEEFAQIDAIFR